MSLHPYDILVRPLLTERSSLGGELRYPKYTFVVSMSSNKIQVRRAVEAAFDVKVRNVRTVRVKGKRKRLRIKKLGRRPNWKKAIVTLEEGQSINLI